MAGTPLRWGARVDDEAGSAFAEIAIGCLDALQTARDRVWKQYEGTTTWAEIVDVIGLAMAEVEDALDQVDQARRWVSAVGVQLEEIGAAVGRPRGSLVSDDDYRTAILVDAATLYASGTIPEIIELANALAPGAELAEFYPAAIRLRVPDLTASQFDLLASVLDDLPAAGVAALLSTYPAATTGGWSSISGSVSTPAAWSSVYGAVSNTRAHWASARGIGA